VLLLLLLLGPAASLFVQLLGQQAPQEDDSDLDFDL
jgi:hypothetical protein